MQQIIHGTSVISRVMAKFGGLLLFLGAILISLDVIFRMIFKSSFFQSYELSSYIFAISITFGMSYALISRAHIRIEVLYGLLPLKWQSGLDIFACTTLTIIVGIVTYRCGLTVLNNLEMGARSNSSLAIPLIIPQIFWLLGWIWFNIVVFIYSIIGVKLIIKGKFSESNRLIGISSLEEEISASGVRQES